MHISFLMVTLNLILNSICNMKKIISSIIGLSTFAVTFAADIVLPQVPPSAQGQTSGNVGKTLENVVIQFKNISGLVYSSMFVVALILFFVGIFKYLAPGKGAEDKAAGYKYMGFGVVALFVMVAVWGIVSFISQTLGIGVGGQVAIPGIPVNAQGY